MATGDRERLLVGWGSADVTPAGPCFLRGQFHARISTHVADPLTVTALAIEAAGDQVVMVSCDRAMIEEGVIEDVRARLTGIPGLDPRKVFLNATHTHTAPELIGGRYPDPGRAVVDGDDYRPQFLDGVAAAVGQAWESRAAGLVGWGMGHAVVGHNRRACFADGSSRMYANTNDPAFTHLEGGEDPSVDLLFTWSPEGELTGMVVNLACPSQVTEGERYVSADFWHETRAELRRRLGDKLFVAGQCAPAGDQSPHFLIHKAPEARMRRLRGISERQEIALKLADAVERVIPVARTDAREELLLRHEVLELGLTRRMVSDEELAESQAEAAALRAEYNRLAASPEPDYTALSRAWHRGHWFAGVEERHRIQATEPTYPVEIHLIRMSELAWATNQFELFLDYGQRIKARSQAEQTICIQLVGPGTYLPTAKAVAGKSYGAGAPSNVVGPEGGQELVEATVTGLNKLFAPVDATVA